MTETNPYEHALGILAQLVWCHENRDRHPLGHEAFERQEKDAWDSATKLVRESGSAGAAAPGPISREELARFLAEAIREEVYGEFALIEKARLKESGENDVPLAGGETAETVGTILWERGDYSDIAQACKNCGAILGYFYLARHFDLALPPEVLALEVWGDTINPS